MPSPNDDPLASRARDVAVEILTAHEGRTTVTELLAEAYLVGRFEVAQELHHVRVITGTGNTSERRELAALCRGIKEQP